ncbi:cement protein 3B variant 3 [Echinococcus multilocularis]|uniref:Cement protein 3B variant 3 n=1 Tax=Echinococcus multilocularis TaxID=6211 RepID=A0A068YNM6_ECHMU|nr:cement protein 3B variant 3 [Echinococcus multilocularis]
MECPYSKPIECTNAFCLSKQNIVNLSKRRGTFPFHKHNKYSKLAEHFEYNHIPAHLSSVQNLHFKSILCTRNGLAIVHLARNLITQFGIVDLHIHKFLGTFGRQSVKYSPDSVAARISPDSSLCLIRLPWSRISRVTTLQLYSLRTRELITELPLTTATLRLNPVNTPTPTTSSFTGFEDDTASVQTDLQDRNEETPEPVCAFGGYNRPSAILFDFDPRFENSRILLANVHFVQTQRNSGYSSLQHYHRRFSLGEGFFEAQAPCLSLVRLPSWQRIAKTRDFGGLPDSLLQEQRPDRRLGSGINILQVFYSPAGHLIFAVVTTASTCRCGSLAQALLFNNFCHGSSEAVLGFGNSPDLSQQRHWSTGEGGVGEVGAFTTQLPPPPPGYTPLFLTVFHSDSLNTLRVIRFDRPLCPLHTCPTNYMPIMSRCGARLALIALATVGVGSSGVKRKYRGGRRGLVEMEGNSGTPRRRRINTLNIPESATVTAGTAQNRPSSSHLCPNWIEGDWETNAWNEEETHLTGKSASIDTGSSSPGRRKLQEMVFVYQLEPPPTLQAIARQKIRQYYADTTLDHLGLPPGLVAYLRFQPSFSCSGSCLSRSESLSTLSALLTPLRSNSLEL